MGEGKSCDVRYFYPRSPCGERRATKSDQGASNQFLSTLSLRRATTVSTPNIPKEQFLSTLSLRRATSSVNTADQEARFLSTLSLRRATFASSGWLQIIYNFYPRSPCGERRYWFGVSLVGRAISIHALLAESDGKSPRRCVFHRISIHALLAESDQWPGGLHRTEQNFYPRSPCGERRFCRMTAEK